MGTLRRLLGLLNDRERREAVALLLMVSLMALLDVLGVASILPFMAVMADPQIVEKNAILARLRQSLGLDAEHDLRLALGSASFLLLTLSLTFKAITTYAQLRFSMLRGFSIGKRLIEGYLRQPYAWFLHRHSADLGRNILSEVHTVVTSGIVPAINLISQGAVVLALVSLMILVDPVLAFSITALLGTAYGTLFVSIRKTLTKLGAERAEANGARFVAIADAFGAIKEVKTGALEEAFIKRFTTPALVHANHTAIVTVLGQLPRFLLEAIAFGGILLLTLYLLSRGQDFSGAIPLVAVYAFAGYRLMPALQQMYSSVTQLRSVGPTVASLHWELERLGHRDSTGDAPLVPFRGEIVFDGVCYAYPGSTDDALRGVSLTIPKGATVAVVGASGSGKTTLVDLLLGLLEPRQGSIKVDGELLDDRTRSVWRRAVGYVPQQVYIADDTVTANIAFGVDKDAVRHDQVERAARIAGLHDFVIDKLPEQYSTKVGERGMRLSGGQRQRIGIARAMYHNPVVLVLDEATSALDSVTERNVNTALRVTGSDITIVIVAHRITTVSHCERIFVMERGELKEQGDFEELSRSGERFQRLAGMGEWQPGPP